MVFIPTFSCCTIKNIELYSENDKFYSNYPLYFLKITLNYDDGKNKGTVVIPKVSVPIHPDPKYWGWKLEHADGCIPRTTLDPCGGGDFDILPDEKGRLAYEERKKLKRFLDILLILKACVNVLARKRRKRSNG